MATVPTKKLDKKSTVAYFVSEPEQAGMMYLLELSGGLSQFAPTKGFIHEKNNKLITKQYSENQI